jgi:hypothetical protein
VIDGWAVAVLTLDNTMGEGPYAVVIFIVAILAKLAALVFYFKITPILHSTFAVIVVGKALAVNSKIGWNHFGSSQQEKGYGGYCYCKRPPGMVLHTTPPFLWLIKF